MKFSILLSLFIFLTQLSFSQDFITKWVFADTATEIQFSTLTTDTVHYTWNNSPSSHSGSGSFIQISPGEVSLSGFNIKPGDTLTINMTPDHLNRFYFESGQDQGKLYDVFQWGDVPWTSMSKTFAGCYRVNITASDTPDLNNVTSMDSMFFEAYDFNDDIGHWNVSNVTDMHSMFNNAYDFNQVIGSWDVSRVRDMSYMFYSFNKIISQSSHSSFDKDIGKWDVSNVKDMSYMFATIVPWCQGCYGSPFNQNIGNWDVSKVEDMSLMFLNVMSFNQDIGEWNVSNVSDMSDMFAFAGSFNQDLGSWELSSVTDMTFMMGASGIDCDHYSATLFGWQNNNPSVTDVMLGAAGLEYGASANEARDSLINVQGWTIEGDQLSGMACDELVNIEFAPSRDRFKLTIYPNPSSGKITVKGNQFGSGHFRVINSVGRDVTGQSIIEQQTNNLITINLSDLPSGLYVVQSPNGSGIMYKE